MPNFKNGFTNKDLVAVFNQEAFDKAKADGKKVAFVNVQVDKSGQTKKAIKEEVTGPDGAWAASASLAKKAYKDKETGEKRTSYSVAYTIPQIESMLAASGGAAKTSDKGVTYAPFKADVLSDHKGSFSVNTKTIQPPTNTKPFNIDKHVKNCQYAIQAFRDAHPAKTTAEPTAEAEATVEAEAEAALPEA